MSALKKLPPPDMTVDEFLDWSAKVDGRWQLRDGVPEMMAPPNGRHGVIQGRLVTAINNHLDRIGSVCVSAATPGVIPRGRSKRDMLIPDIGISRAPSAVGTAFPDPCALIEILSLKNAAQTRANVAAFTTIESVIEIVVVHCNKISAEILRRLPDGSWPADPALIARNWRLVLSSIGLDMALTDAYRGTDLLPVDRQVISS